MWEVHRHRYVFVAGVKRLNKAWFNSTISHFFYVPLVNFSFWYQKVLCLPHQTECDFWCTPSDKSLHVAFYQKSFPLPLVGENISNAMMYDPHFIKINPWYPPTTSYTLKAWNYPWNNPIMVLCEYTYPLTLDTFISPSMKFGAWVGDPFLLNYPIMSTFHQWHDQTLKTTIITLETHLVSIHVPYKYILPSMRFGVVGWPIFIKMNPSSLHFTSDMIKP